MADQKEYKRSQIVFNIDYELRKQFKIKCIENNTNMRDEVIKFIRNYIKK
jgi:hypothetical protein